MRDKELESIVERTVEKLAQARVDQNMTMSELSRRTGLHYSAISLIETGKRQPTLLTVLNLAKHLEIQVHELFCK